MPVDRWQKLIESVASDDGLPTRDVGSWTADKLWWWNNYIQITTTAMVGKPEWPTGLTYVDLFSGPGVLTLKESGKRIPGSPLIAANAPKKFTRILLCDSDSACADACERRLSLLDPKPRFKVFCSDCNKCIHELAAEIPRQSLTLAFVDPLGFDAQFETLRALTNRRAVDLLILFADRMDLIRNIEMCAGQSHSRIDDMLGPGIDWRDRWKNVANRTASNVSKLFLQIYQEQLERHLGYQHFADEVLSMRKGAPLYRILYASRHSTGLKFWKKSTRDERRGGRLSFD